MLQKSPLGRQSPQPTCYNPGLLFPIPRHLGRTSAGLSASTVCRGVDTWTAYEMSWLNAQGVPQVAVLQIDIDASSPCIIESKSFKLYLNSFADTAFDSTGAVLQALEQDISAVAAQPCRVSWLVPGNANRLLTPLAGSNIDATPISHPTFERDPSLLTQGGTEVTQRLTSDLLKTNCPVTGQPDWGSVMVHYTGPAICPAQLLRYILSYRSHTGFHELCVEQIFSDILARCAPRALSVYARYTRRGGLDINPFRSNFEQPPQNIRTYRQ